MSKENLKEFLQKVEGDQEIQEKLKSIDTENTEEMSKKFISIAHESGYDVDLKDFEVEKELSSDELDNVAGGRGGQKESRERFIKATGKFLHAITDGNNIIESGKKYWNDLFFN